MVSLVSLAALAECGGGPVGEASLTVAALSSADVARVEVTIEGAGIAPPIVQELARAGAEWRGANGGIPAGTDRTFTVVAYDGMNVEIYRGVSTGVTNVGDGTTTVAMVLQQSMSVTGMESPPDITSVTVVPGILAPSAQAA